MKSCTIKERDYESNYSKSLKENFEYKNGIKYF